MALQSIKLRLPGTVTPVSIYTQHQITARQAKTLVVDQYHLKDIEERKLVLTPTPSNPGRIIEIDQIVNIDSEDILELWRQPYLVNIVLAGGI